MSTIKNKIPLIALAILLAGCSPSSSTTADGSGGVPAAQETTDVVKKQDLTGYTFFDAKLMIPQSAQATAYSPYDTPVVSVSTEAGKHVSRGEPIVKLTIPGADSATSAAKASVNSANAELSAQKSATSGPVQDAKKALTDAQAAEKTAKDSGVQADIDTASAARVDAENALKKAIADQREAVAPSKEAAQLANATLSTAREDAAKGIVRAPITGTIVSLAAKPGMQATSTSPLAQIINFDAVRVQGTVPAELKDMVTKRSHVIIALNAANSVPLDGIVTEIKVLPPSQGQTSPGYLANIEFADPAKIVTPIDSVKRVGVKTGTVKDAIVVPVAAVITKDGKTYVQVKNGDNWTETAVTTGITDGALIEIKSGLTEGQTIRVTK